MRAFLLIAVLAALQLLFVPGHYLGAEHDDVQFVLAAHSLRDGRYSLGISPGDPPLTFATPGLPALLLPAAFLSGENPAAYELLCWGWLVAADALAWLWFRRRMAAGAAAAATALFALNPLVLSRAGVVMSEIPFLAFSLALLLALESRRALPGWLAGLTLGFAWLIRPAALALWAAVGIHYLSRGERRQAGESLLCALAPALAWKFWVNMNGAPLAEFQELSLTLGVEGAAGWLRVAGVNLRAALALWGRSVLPWIAAGDGGLAALAAGGILAATAGLGLARRLRGEGYDPGLGALAFGVLLHAFWPYWYERYLPPFLPFLIWGLYLCAESLPGGRRRAPWVLAALALMPLPAQGRVLLRERAARSRPELARTYAWVRENTPSQALFAGAFYGRDAFYTGRPFIPLPAGPPLAEELRERRAAFVLWQEPPDLGSSLGGRFGWRRVLEGFAGELEGPGFSRVFAAPEEGAAVYAVRH